MDVLPNSEQIQHQHSTPIRALDDCSVRNTGVDGGITFS